MDSEFAGEDFLDFKCPHCGALNSFPQSAAKLIRECVNCLEPFLVPEFDGGTALAFPLPYETPKLRLRKFEASDWKDLLEFEFDEEDEATGWIYQITQAPRTGLRQTFWVAVEELSHQKVVGCLGLAFTDTQFNQVQLSLSSGTTVNDLILEANRAAIRFCFQRLHIHRVEAWCDGRDTELHDLLRKSGMRQEAEFVKQTFRDNEWRNTVWFAILEEEFFKSQSSDTTSS